MKAYIIITLNLCAVHGANMYIYNKVRFLKERGYETYVYSAEQGEIPIFGLREYRKYQSPYFRFYPACFRNKTVQGVIRKIREDIRADECEECIVETSNIYSALWGEILAKDLHCRHLAFIMQEEFGYSESEKRFLRFKLGRHELAGISDSSVSRMLEDDTIPFEENMHVRAYCNNTIDDCEDTISPLLDPGACLTVGSIGRLEKGYVLPLMRRLREIFDASPGKKYNLVMIGGTRANNQIKEIRNVFKDSPNVNLILTGFLFPIPSTFVEKCDIFISASGSAQATYYRKRPTIKINPKTGDFVGIIGLTYTEGQYDLYSANYPLSELKELMDMAISKKDEIRFTDDMEDGSYGRKMDTEFTRQLEMVRLEPSFDYYDTYLVRFEGKLYRPFNVLGKVLGVNFLYKSLVYARKIIK